MTDLGRCEHRILHTWHFVRCTNKAKMTVPPDSGIYSGHSYCGVHDPIKREAKYDARHKATMAKWEAERVKRDQESADRKIGEFVRLHSPSLLAAIEAAMEAYKKLTGE